MKDGGGAFPALLSVAAIIPPGTHVTQTIMETGMSLRDYFAAQALTLLSSMSWPTVQTSAASIADTCYSLADAMLAERSKP